MEQQTNLRIVSTQSRDLMPDKDNRKTVIVHRHSAKFPDCLNAKSNEERGSPAGQASYNCRQRNTPWSVLSSEILWWCVVK